MDTMRALVYDRPGVCCIRELPMPQCGEDEVVIKVMAASICKGADRRHHTTGHKLGRYPITTGHEFAGYVYQVGSTITTCKVGDRVTADNAVPCGKCYFCQREMYTHCLNFNSVGHSIPGGFAQYLKVKENSVFQVPEHLSFNDQARWYLAGNCEDFSARENQKKVPGCSYDRIYYPSNDN